MVVFVGNMRVVNTLVTSHDCNIKLDGCFEEGEIGITLKMRFQYVRE